MTDDSISTLSWRKSTHSHVSGTCLEVAVAGNRVFVRDSKDVSSSGMGPALGFDRSCWQSLIDDVKNDCLQGSWIR